MSRGRQVVDGRLGWQKPPVTTGCDTDGFVFDKCQQAEPVLIETLHQVLHLGIENSHDILKCFEISNYEIVW